ncbi:MULTISPECIES: EAL domain-containing protein [unclassified Halomonas]|uniref:bifunctional diguanylate cyclase/phosphodiesterase n=1 Tax=unclassified Halomonas TaxID=2609666 RepID=UPI0007D92160|nr:MULTISPECIES: EAL domain-containing protein [unclassified Halomonas]MBT2786634.1 EAL domain-containing protein [Halomonas sp. ISL-106]MBT2797656.1 EAL domain-containing protein [Halomonas sp. ISL-104]OAL59000.1 diguanylate cyclase [Halomonas sp. ALS9]
MSLVLPQGQLDQFFLLSQDLFCCIDFEGTLLQVNPAFETLLGYSSEKLIGRACGVVVNSLDHPVIERALKRMHQGEKVIPFEVRAVSATGKQHWLEVTASFGDGVIYVIARVITRRKAADEQLLRNQRLFKIAGETALIGGWYVDMADGKPIWSDELSHIHGMPAGFQPSVKEAFAFYAPESRERLLAAFNACCEHGVSFDSEYEVITRQGKHLWVRAIGKAVCDDEGRIIQVQGASQDITEQKQLREELTQLAHRLTMTLDSITDSFFTLDTDWRFSYVNREAERTLKRSEGELLGQHIWQIFPDAVGSRFQKEYQRAASQQVAVHFEAFNPRLNSWLEVHVYPSTEGLAVYFRDINERKLTEHQLKLLERSVESSTNGVIIVDAQRADWPIVYVNAAFERITGYSRSQVLGRNCRFLQGEETDPATIKQLREGVTEQREVHVVIRNYRRDGTVFWNDLYISPVLDENGQVTHFIGVQNDISEQREYQAQLAHNAHHDALTGLPNRLLLGQRLEQGCVVARRYQRYIAVLFIDLDDFKPINDTLGHEVGDFILVEVAKRLENELRPWDTVARFGSDEFVVLLPDLAHQNDVIQVVERVLQGLSPPYSYRGSELRITASIGIAINDGSIKKPRQLIQQADLAMYKAKRRGRNTYHWYTEDLNRKVSERVSLRSALQHAIEQQQFELHYQPQIHAPSGRVVGVEALIRWPHPERGNIPPSDFISLAEDTGQIIPISEWVLATACRDAQQLNGLGLGEITMAVNISPMQFQRPGFFASIEQVLASSGLTSSLLELELTESVLMDSAEQAIQALKSLRTLGVQIALDDFGTGFSSLSYLKRLPINRIKIDRSFVRDVISDRHDAAIIDGVVAMANKMGLEVLVEGVEEAEQFNYLQQRGCDYFQGYYFARPMPLDALREFLHNPPAVIPSHS